MRLNTAICRLDEARINPEAQHPAFRLEPLEQLAGNTHKTPEPSGDEPMFNRAFKVIVFMSIAAVAAPSCAIGQQIEPTKSQLPAPAHPKIVIPEDLPPGYPESRELLPFKIRSLKEARRATRHWEAALLILSAIDTAQTADCISRHVCHEGNPLIGKHPTVKRLIVTRLLFDAAHVGLISLLNRKHPREAWSLAMGGAFAQGGVVLLNARFAF